MSEPEKPFALFWRHHRDLKWACERFETEPAARARIKTVESKPGWWVLRNRDTVIDQSLPKK